MRKNCFEEQLFKCEDERFECDMFVTWYISAIAETEKLFSCPKATLEKPDLSRELHGCLKRIFGENTPNVLEKVYQNPKQALPWLLNKLKAKKDCLFQLKKEQNKTWRDVCEKNFYKSLDHRAFYFKQSEKKNTNSKAFLAEIQERRQKKTSDKTPILIKKGGTQRSVYYNSLSLLSPEIYHIVPVDGDEIALMSDMYSHNNNRIEM